MFANLWSGRCKSRSMSATVLLISQALVWAGVTIAVALELRGSPAAESVMLWLTSGAACSLMLATGLSTRGRDDARDDRDAS